MVFILYFAESDDAPCVSTGDTDALSKPENQALAGLLVEIGTDSIKLPPGTILA